MPAPKISIDPRLLPGAILLPTYSAYCRSCDERTTHAGLGDEDGNDLGSFCISCGTKDTRREWREDEAERTAFEAHAERTGLMQTQPDLLRTTGE